MCFYKLCLRTLSLSNHSFRRRMKLCKILLLIIIYSFVFSSSAMSLRELCTLFAGLQHIEQDERVSVGTDGSLYFSHALQKDSRQDYCCFADFLRIRTIVQKPAMAVEVKPCRCIGVQSNTTVVYETSLKMYKAKKKKNHTDKVFEHQKP